MNRVPIEGATCAVSKPVNPTHNPTTLRLFNNNYQHVQNEAGAPGLLPGDIHRLIEGTVNLLNEYSGPDDDSAFCEWITTVLAPQAERLSSFYAMQTEHRKTVLHAIWSVIKSCEDLGADVNLESATVAELAGDTWMRVFLDLDNWLSPGTAKVTGRKPAKLSTRLYACARLQALGWRVDRIRKRARFADIDDLIKSENKQTESYSKPKRPQLRPIILGPSEVVEGEESLLKVA